MLLLPLCASAVTVNLSDSHSLAADLTRLSGTMRAIDAHSGEFTRIAWSGVGSSSYTALYTPGGTAASFSTAESLTVSFDARVAGANSSIGLYFVDATNNRNNILVLLNIDSSNTDSLFRVFYDGNPTTGTAGTAPGGTPSGSADIGIHAGDLDWGKLSFTLSTSGEDGRRMVYLSAGDHTFSYSLAGSHIDWAQTELILRVADTSASGAVGVDIRLNPSIPEPSVAVSLVGVAALGVCLLRRRRR